MALGLQVVAQLLAQLLPWLLQAKHAVSQDAMSKHKGATCVKKIHFTHSNQHTAHPQHLLTCTQAEVQLHDTGS